MTALLGGYICHHFVRVLPEPYTSLQSVVTRQIRVQGSCASPGEYLVCIDLQARKAIRVDPLISGVARLTEGAAWFKHLHGGEPNLIKVILVPYF